MGISSWLDRSLVTWAGRKAKRIVRLGQSHESARVRTGHARIAVEPLESRAMLSSYSVTSALDTGDEGTLRWAVEQANLNPGDDEITFDASLAGQTILTTSVLEVTDSTGALAILGLGQGQTIVQRDGSAGKFSLFSVNRSSLYVGDMTLADGWSADDGGAVRTVGGALSAFNVEFLNNRADGSGGAISSESFGLGGIIPSTLQLDSVVLQGNQSGGQGSAILFTGNTVISNAQFTENVSATGSFAVWGQSRGVAQINSSVFTGNGNDLASGRAVNIEGSTFTGAVALSGASELISNTQFLGQVTVGGSHDGITHFFQCTFDNPDPAAPANRVEAYAKVTFDSCVAGPAPFDLQGSVNVTIRNSTWTRTSVSNAFVEIVNSSIIGRGTATDPALSLATAVATISNSTVANNEGVGIDVRTGGHAILTNVTVVGNDRGIVLGDSQATASVTNSIVALNTSADVTGDLYSSGYPIAHNLIGVDPLLGTLDYHGGATLVYDLLPGSPAIDAGSTAAANAARLATDQRGTGFSRDRGATVDIGAYEEQNPPANPYPSLLADSLVVYGIEGGAVLSNTGSIDDAGGTETLTLTASVGTVTFSQNAWYWTLEPADGPLTLTDVTLTATNALGLSKSIRFDAIVANDPPVVVLDPLPSGVFHEGDSITLTGNFRDFGAIDTHTVLVNWGDVDSPRVSTFVLGASSTLYDGQIVASQTDDSVLTVSYDPLGATGQVGFTITGTLPDNGRASGGLQADDFGIGVRVVDSDGDTNFVQRGGAPFLLTFDSALERGTRNHREGGVLIQAPPRSQLDFKDSDGDGSTDMTLSGGRRGSAIATFSTTDGGPISLLAFDAVFAPAGSNGSLPNFWIPDNNTSFNFSRPGHYELPATFSNLTSFELANGRRSSVAVDNLLVQTRGLQVLNVDPTFELGSDVTIAGSAHGVVSLTDIAITDPGTLDTFTGTVDFGDGTGTQTLQIGPRGEFREYEAVEYAFDLNHTFATSGTYNVTVTVTDDDGGSHTDTFTVTVFTLAYLDANGSDEAGTDRTVEFVIGSGPVSLADADLFVVDQDPATNSAFVTGNELLTLSRIAGATGANTRIVRVDPITGDLHELTPDSGQNLLQNPAAITQDPTTGIYYALDANWYDGSAGSVTVVSIDPVTGNQTLVIDNLPSYFSNSYDISADGQGHLYIAGLSYQFFTTVGEVFRLDLDTLSFESVYRGGGQKVHAPVAFDVPGSAAGEQLLLIPTSEFLFFSYDTGVTIQNLGDNQIVDPLLYPNGLLFREDALNRALDLMVYDGQVFASNGGAGFTRLYDFDAMDPNLFDAEYLTLSGSIASRQASIDSNGVIYAVDLSERLLTFDTVTQNVAELTSAGELPGLRAVVAGMTRVAGLQSATVRITNLFDANHEVLSVDTSGTSLLASFDAAAGTLTITGTASFADYERVLATVTYNNLDATPAAVERIIAFTLNDGGGNGPATYVHVNFVAPPNTAPTAHAGGPYVVAENATVTINGGQSFDGQQPTSTLTYLWDLDGDGIFGETGAAASNGLETGEQTGFRLSAGLPLGERSITLRVIDSGGLQSEATSTVTVVDDDTAGPNINIAGFVNDGDDGATNRLSWGVTDASGVAQTSVTFTRNGQTVHTSTVANGNFNFDSLGLGEYTLTIVATDADNDRPDDASSSTLVRTFVVTDDDTQAPTITLSGASGEQTDAEDQTISWTVDDASTAGSTITVTRDGQNVFSSNSGVGSFDFNHLGAGTYIVEVVATDRDMDWTGDRLSSSATRTVIVTDDDTTAPVITLTGLDASSLTQDDQTLLWSAADDQGIGTVEARLYFASDLSYVLAYETWSGQTTGTFDLNPTFDWVGGGDFVLVLSAADGDNDWTDDASVATASIAFTVVAPPVIYLDASSVSVAEGQLATLTGSYTASEPVTLLASLGTITDNGDGTWTWSYFADDNALQQDVTLSTDLGGSATFSLEVTNTGPSVAITGVSSAQVGQPVSFALTAGDDSAADALAGFGFVVNFGDGDSLNIAPTANNGNGLVVPHAYANAGTYTVRVVALDKDGGTSQERTHVITIAGVNPAISPFSIGCWNAAVYDRSDYVYIKGTSNDDMNLTAATAANAWIEGGWGGDRITGNAGNDLLFADQAQIGNVDGDSDTDELKGIRTQGHNMSAGEYDQLVGNAGHDLLFGSDGVDRLYGDTLDANNTTIAGNDALFGFNGNDMLIGGAGDDLLIGGAGSDVLDGGAGFDSVCYGDLVFNGTGDHVAGVVLNLSSVAVQYQSGLRRGDSAIYLNGQRIAEADQVATPGSIGWGGNIVRDVAAGTAAHKSTNNWLNNVDTVTGVERFTGSSSTYDVIVLDAGFVQTAGPDVQGFVTYSNGVITYQFKGFETIVILPTIV